MNRIVRLDSKIVRQISAGEVVTSLFSVAKELIENALDAGGTEIMVRVEGTGMVVEDNGTGIGEDDFDRVCMAHNTSKYTDRILLEQEYGSFGFRGEALYSINQVGEVEVTTRAIGVDVGYRLSYRNGELVEKSKVAVKREGTRIGVMGIFSNNYIRKNEYYRGDRIRSRELGRIVDLVEAYNINYSGRIRMKLVDGDTGREYGEEVGIGNRVLDVDEEGLRIVVGNGKGRFHLLINNRLVEDKVLRKMICGRIGRNRFVFISTKVEKIDANIEPSKRKVLVYGREKMHQKIMKEIDKIGETKVVEESKRVGNIEQKMRKVSEKIYVDPSNRRLDEYENNKVEEVRVNKVKRVEDEATTGRKRLSLKETVYIGSDGNTTYVQLNDSLVQLNDIVVENLKEFNKIKMGEESVDYEVVGSLREFYNRFGR
ncbi:MLH1 [Enterospora canceri]|uniref:MLH1 n=1 Tax=Enterospora canceri TaxID=1081671 RepID=A0A1Y1S8Z2_9MICR|nr:MLH1 [Enterospora canceri]